MNQISWNVFKDDHPLPPLGVWSHPPFSLDPHQPLLVWWNQLSWYDEGGSASVSLRASADWNHWNRRKAATYWLCGLWLRSLWLSLPCLSQSWSSSENLWFFRTLYRYYSYNQLPQNHHTHSISHSQFIHWKPQMKNASFWPVYRQISRSNVRLFQENCPIASCLCYCFALLETFSKNQKCLSTVLSILN